MTIAKAVEAQALQSWVLRAPWMDTEAFEISIRATAEPGPRVHLTQTEFDNWAHQWARRMRATQTLGAGEAIPVINAAGEFDVVHIRFGYEGKVKG